MTAPSRLCIAEIGELKAALRAWSTTGQPYVWEACIFAHVFELRFLRSTFLNPRSKYFAKNNGRFFAKQNPVFFTSLRWLSKLPASCTEPHPHLNNASPSLLLIPLYHPYILAVGSYLNCRGYSIYQTDQTRLRFLSSDSHPTLKSIKSESRCLSSWHAIPCGARQHLFFSLSSLLPCFLPRCG